MTSILLFILALFAYLLMGAVDTWRNREEEIEKWSWL
jgi:hypothetical protein